MGFDEGVPIEHPWEGMVYVDNIYSEGGGGGVIDYVAVLQLQKALKDLERLLEGLPGRSMKPEITRYNFG